MRVFRPYTEKYNNWDEGDCRKPIDCFFKKGYWKRINRKKFLRNLSRENLRQSLS